MFPEGSHGNGSAMRVAPVGLAFLDDFKLATSVAIEASRPTHSHSLAYQGAVLQAVAVATAASASKFNPRDFLRAMRDGLVHFSDLLQDTSVFERSLDAIEEGLQRQRSCMEMSSVFGTGVAAHEAVPVAAYCFLRHPDSYRATACRNCGYTRQDD
jgi:poly(ADP-ribose) glycohydrolase ARH3